MASLKVSVLVCHMIYLGCILGIVRRMDSGLPDLFYCILLHLFADKAEKNRDKLVLSFIGCNGLSLDMHRIVDVHAGWREDNLASWLSPFVSSVCLVSFTIISTGTLKYCLFFLIDTVSDSLCVCGPRIKRSLPIKRLSNQTKVLHYTGSTLQY